MNNFSKNQWIYHGNKLQLLKIFNTIPYLTSILEKDTLTLNFLEIVHSQAAVITAKSLNKFADGVIKFAHNLSSGYSRVDNSDSVLLTLMTFDNCLKSYALEARD